MYSLQIDTPYWQLAIFAVMVGAGLGLSMQTIVIALQNSVEFKDMGVATSSNTFFRSLGSVFGTALFGAILTNRLSHYLASNFAELAAKNPDAAGAVDPSKLAAIQNNTSLIKTLPAQVQTAVLDAFVHSFHIVFIVAAPVVAVGFFVALFLRETPLRTSEDYAAARNESAGEALG
jgi:ABC-type sugar transport system permease subunit